MPVRRVRHFIHRLRDSTPQRRHFIHRLPVEEERRRLTEEAGRRRLTVETARLRNTVRKSLNQRLKRAEPGAKRCGCRWLQGASPAAQCGGESRGGLPECPSEPPGFRRGEAQIKHFKVSNPTAKAAGFRSKRKLRLPA